MSEKPILKPCPFCLSGNVRMTGLTEEFVMCMACSASGPSRATPAEAIAAWNRRASEAAALDGEKA